MTGDRVQIVALALARCSPADVPEDAGSEQLVRSLQFLDAAVDPPTVIAAGYGAGILVTVVGGLAVGVAPTAVRLPLLAVVLCAAVGVIHAVHRLPVLFAALQRTVALGRVPSLVGRAVLRMHVDPSEEAAVRFTAESGTGPLARSLRRHVRGAEGAKKSGLQGFAEDWRQWFPALPRATTLLAAAASAPPTRREHALDRALSTVLEGTQDRLAEFVTTIRGPATALYAFGVLLPLALVAVLPAARAAGVPITPPIVVALYDIVLPIALFAAGGWLLVRRPVAFPPPTVPASHPSIPDRQWPRIAAGFIAGSLAWIVTGAVVSWARPMVAVGIGLGVTLLLLARPYVSVRERARAVEVGLVDALYLVGRQVGEGRSVEGAVGVVGDELDGETGAAFKRASAVCTRLGVGVERAFLGEYGALSDVPSPRAHDAVTLLSVAAREGQPASDAIIATAAHLDRLQTVEREARHELAQITGTLQSTGSIFAPLVAGATVALADGMATFADDGSELSPIPPETLGLSIGVYVLVLSVLLTALSTALARGLDRPLLAYRVGGALCSASVVFTAAVVGAQLAF